MRIFLTLLAALVWGVGSWWWYTCKVKGFCSSDSVAPVAKIIAPIDTDGDGLTDDIEQKLGLDPNSDDSDQDGLKDGIEVGENTDQAIDTDGDGNIDALDSDDDNDGIATKDESPDANADGNSEDAVDTDNDGIANYLDTDSDGDGLSDAEEALLGLNPFDADSDQDGLKDAIEVGANKDQAIDSDDDGKIDALDSDDDNDGIATKNELADANADGNPEDAVDTDNDGTANYLDTDSDGDSLSDSDEARLSLNPLVTDTDGDGVNDAAEIGSDINSPLDTDGDGIIDALDTENTPKVEEPAAEAPTIEPVPIAEPEPESKPEDQVSVDTTASDDAEIDAANIYFPFRSANPQLSGDAKSYFDKVVTALKANPELKVSLIGHTDNIGNPAGNEKLGLKRAQIIKQTLVDQGAPENQMETSSKGENSPIASNDTQEGRDQNRRVELLPQ